VLLAVCQDNGIESEVIPRIASGFAGGIGNTGSVCGAVIGAVMAIGLMQKKADSMEEGLANLAVGQEFRRRYETEMETISCRELTGLDLTTQEGLEKIMTSETAQAACFSSVGVAYRVVSDLLKEIS
jgi:C_GCAxxG_C_C family probable redox protein